MKIVSTTILCMFLVTGCAKKKIEITTEYIVNPNWNEYEHEFIITRVKLMEDSIISDLSNLSQHEILSKFEEDSSFEFTGYVKPNGESYAERKVYFNRDNGFLWRTSIDGPEHAVIGNLQKGEWYKLSGLLNYAYFIYVFIDSTNKLHRFGVNEANY